MALIERLMGIEDFEKIPVHQFIACLYGLTFAKLVDKDIKNVFKMDETDSNEFDTLIYKVLQVDSQVPTTSDFKTCGIDLVRFQKIIEFEHILVLAERNMFYTNADEVRRALGLI